MIDDRLGRHLDPSHRAYDPLTTRPQAAKALRWAREALVRAIGDQPGNAVAFRRLVENEAYWDKHNARKARVPDLKSQTLPDVRESRLPLDGASS